jgi:hypothetical protein
MEEKEQHIGPQMPKDIHEAVGRVSACLRHAQIEFDNLMGFLIQKGYYMPPVPAAILDTMLLDRQLGASQEEPVPEVHRIEAPLTMTLQVGEKPVILQKGDKIFMQEGLVMVHRYVEAEGAVSGVGEIVGTGEPDAILEQFKVAYKEATGEIPAQFPKDSDAEQLAALIAETKDRTSQSAAELYNTTHAQLQGQFGGIGRRTLEAIHGVQEAMGELSDLTGPGRNNEIDIDTAIVMKDGLPDGTETIIRMGGHEWGISTTLEKKPSGPIPDVVAEVEAAGGVEKLANTVHDVLAMDPVAEVPAPQRAFQRMMDNFFAEHKIGMFEKFFDSRVIEGGQGNIGMEPKPENWYLTQYGEDILRVGPIRTVSWPPGMYRDYRTKENQLFLRTQNFSFVVTGLPTKPEAILYSLIRNGSASNFEHINEAPDSESEMAFIELLALLSELNWACKTSQKTE